MRKLMKLFGPPTQETIQSPGRRHLLKRAGMFFGAGGALAAIATPAAAASEQTSDQASGIVGLWSAVVSAADNSFPPFPAFENWGGGGTWTGSGQPDLTPAALGSTGWGTWSVQKDGSVHMIGRYWTYSPSAVPTGFAALDFVYTLRADGIHYQGVGPSQFFDTNGQPYGPPTPTVVNGTRIA